MTNDSLEAYPTLTRRAALGAVAAAMGTVAFATETPKRSRLGLVAYNCAFRRKWLQQRDPKFDLFEPLTFLKHCRDVGASVVIHSDGELFKAALARATFCRMSAADLVQVRGLGSALQAAT